MPQVWLVNAVKNQVGQGDGIYHALFFLAVERSLLEGLNLVGCRFTSEIAGEVGLL